MTRVAICLATYNGSSYIDSLLTSLCFQTHHDFIVYIRDDASSDCTLEVILDHDLYKSNRIKIISDTKGNLGFKRNFIKILEKVEEEIVFLCDQDDIWHPEKLSGMISEFGKKLNQRCQLIYCRYYIVDEFLNILDESKSQGKPSDLVYENFIPGCCMAFNKKLLTEVLKYQQLNIYHDWLIGLVNLKEFGEFKFVEKSLVKYRQHSSNVLGEQKQKSIFQTIFHFHKYLKSSVSNYNVMTDLGALTTNSFALYIFRRSIFKLKRQQ